MSRFSLRWSRGLVALGMVLSLAACATKGTTTQDQVAQPPEQLRPVPLQRFSKAPAEDVVKVPAPPLMAAKAEPPSPVASRPLGNVYFEFDRWGLSPEGKKILEQSAEALKQNPTARVLVEGHCDERGSIEYNLVLGERRAQETRRYLLTLGVRNPVGVTSYGKERPVCPDPDESCYSKNRRAHLVLENGR